METWMIVVGLLLLLILICWLVARAKRNGGYSSASSDDSFWDGFIIGSLSDSDFWSSGCDSSDSGGWCD